MVKKNVDLWSWVVVLLVLYFLVAFVPSDYQSVFYGDNSYRTITTDAFVNDFGGLTVNYSINAARNQYDYSQSMVMFVKVNDEWLSADGIIVTDGNNVMRSLVIPKDELLSKNVVEFFYKAARSHPGDTMGLWCWKDDVRSNRVSYRLDDKMVSWTTELYGLNVINADSISIDGKSYGVACSGFRRSPGLVTEPSISSDRLFITRDSSMPGDVAVESLTLKDLMDLRVNKSSYSYVKEVFYLPVTTPAPAVIQCFSDSDCGPDFYCNDKKCYLKGPIIIPPTQSDDDNQPNWLVILIVVVVVIGIIIVRFKMIKKKNGGGARG